MAAGTVRIDEGRHTVVAGGSEWPFTLDLRNGTAVVDIDGQAWRVRPQRWIEKRRLARFAHYGEEFVREQLWGMCVLPDGEQRRDTHATDHAAALLTVAAWLNGGGHAEEALPLDSALLTRVTVAACREMGVAPQVLDDLPPYEVESLWRPARERAVEEIAESGDEEQSASQEASPFTHRILIVPDEEQQPLEAEEHSVNSQPPTPNFQTLEAGAGHPLGIGNWELGVDQTGDGVNSQPPTPNSQTLEAGAGQPLGIGSRELGVDQRWLPAVAGRGADDLPVARGLPPSHKASADHRSLGEGGQPPRGRGASATNRASESRYRVVTGTRRAGPSDPPRHSITHAHAAAIEPSGFERASTGVSDRLRAERSGESADSQHWLVGSRSDPTLAEAERTSPTVSMRPQSAAQPAPPFAPPAESSEPRQRTQSFQDFADEFSERLQAAASELGLLQER